MMKSASCYCQGLGNKLKADTNDFDQPNFVFIASTRAKLKENYLEQKDKKS